MIRVLAALLFVSLPTTALADKAEPGPGQYVGVAAGIDGRFVAKWTIDHLSIGNNDGNSFVGVLARGAPIQRVALLADGTLYTIRGNELGARAPDGNERWTTLPKRPRWSDLVAAGPYVVLLGASEGEDVNDVFWVSKDGGRTFVERPTWEVENFQTTIALRADGTIDYITGYEAACGGGGQSRWVGRVGDTKLRRGAWNMDAPTTATPTVSGQAYAIDSCVERGEALCAQGDPATPVKLDRPITFDSYVFLTQSLGRRSLMLVGRSIVLVDGKSGRVLTTDAPAEVTSFSGTATSAWVVANGHVHHFDGKAWIQ